ncbi:hypothetical protein OESDEN_10977, partial [Oesophagostomum dentatum]
LFFLGPTSCNATSFHCSLSEQCLPLSQRCDGRYDCALEEDEQNCRRFSFGAKRRKKSLAKKETEQLSATFKHFVDSLIFSRSQTSLSTPRALCAADEFACIVSEQCIEANRRCNGITECTDGTDEMNCDVCGNGLFHCAKSGECIPMEERCDGKRQCPHAEDEMLCNYAMFPVCDGIPQCDDGSDEMYCDTGAGTGHYGGESSIAFSSNPNPATPEEPSDYAMDYEEETQAKEDEPSFPMLTIALSSPPPNSKAPVKPAAAKPNRYPAKPSSQAKERTLSVIDKSVAPRNEAPKQLFAQSEDSEADAGVSAPLPAVVHEVKITSDSARPATSDADSRTRLLNQIGTQLNGRVSPQLLSKLEKLLAEEVQTGPKKELSSGTAVESSALM